MNAETRICQNCKNKFTIEPEDFDFYKKIDVPPPTWCPECRLVRRMLWGFDVRTLYHRKCEAPGHSEMIYSSYAPEFKAPLYDQEYWKSDAWDPRSYGREYDFSRSFFEQWKELLDQVPVRNLEMINSVNCEYCKTIHSSKNCYFCTGTFSADACMYSHTLLLSRECIDCDLSTLDEQCYDSFSLDKSFQTTHGVFSEELLNCDFMYDCRNCVDCLGCVGLRNKRYCIFNVQYSKADYAKERQKHDLGSHKGREQVRAQFRALISSRPKKYAITKNAVNCTGDNIINSKNSHFIFQALEDVEDCKYALVLGRGAKNCFDVAGAGLKCADLYDVGSITGSQRVFFSYRINNSHDVYYSRECHDSGYLFGCVGLRSKNYCILNKQYSKKEYAELLPRIIRHMEETSYKSPRGQVYRFGEFPPIEHSPMFYNDSWVIEYFPLTQEEAAAKGYPWRPRAERGHQPTIEMQNLPDHIAGVSDDILKEIISCAHKEKCRHLCAGAFRILPQELRFYRERNIALPRLCPNCRYSEHLAYLTPYKLWNRKCMCQSEEARREGHTFKNTVSHFHGEAACPNTFETAFAPERPDLIYCESCYNHEVA